MKLVLIGGGDYRKRENADIDEEIIKLIDSDSKMLLIPFASPQEKHESWFKAITSNFRDKGINKFDILNEEDNREIIKNKIRQSNILFLIGGDPDKLLKGIKERGIESEIKAFRGLVIGYSAGAMIFGRECIMPPSKSSSFIKIIPGLNVTHYSVIPHYEESQDCILFPLSKNRVIYGIKNKAAILIEGNQTRFIGEVYKIVNSQKQRI